MKQHKLSHSMIALLLVLLLSFGTAPAAFADSGSAGTTTGIIYKGKISAGGWIYQNAVTTYMPTDLFRDCKNIMPGDTLTQDMVIKNESHNLIKVYLEVLPHGDENPLSTGVGQHTTVEKAASFLNQLSMTVTAGEGANQKVLFDIPIGELGTYAGTQSLGYIAPRYGATLQVTVQVPVSLGNAYAFNLANGTGIGELDFRFTVEEIPSGGGEPSTPSEPDDPNNPNNPNEPDNPNDSDDPNNPSQPEDPDNPDDPIVIPGDPVEDIEDPDVPIDAPDTGDKTRILTPVLWMLLGVMGILLLLRKRGQS